MVIEKLSERQSITNFNINFYEKKIRFSNCDDIYDVIDLFCVCDAV